MEHWRRSGVFIVNFGHISHLVLVFLWSTLNIVNFEHVIAGWESFGQSDAPQWPYGQKLFSKTTFSTVLAIIVVFRSPYSRIIM